MSSRLESASSGEMGSHLETCVESVFSGSNGVGGVSEDLEWFRNVTCYILNGSDIWSITGIIVHLRVKSLLFRSHRVCAEIVFYLQDY